MQQKEPSSSAPEIPAKRRFSLFPKPLSQPLSALMKPVCKKHGFAEHRLLTEWHLIAGTQIAGYCLPQKLAARKGRSEPGTLHLTVASGRALELQHLEPLIIDRINAYFGYPAVGRLAFRQTHAPLFYPMAAKPAKKPGGNGEEWSALASGCEDEALRAALQSLGAALAAVEK